MIPRDTVERIYSAAHIEEVVGDYVTLKRRGANLIGLCPFHDEKTGSFTVSPSKGIFKCFGCGKAGDVVGFVREIEQCDYPEALRILAKRYHIEIEERELTADEKQAEDDRESMFVVNEWCNRWFQQQLWETQEGQAVGLSYLRQRGLRDDIIHKFQIGYSPDKSLLTIEAHKQSFQDKYLLNDNQNAPYIGTGVCVKGSDGRLFDRFHSRVIFPFFNNSGKVIGFAGRIMVHNDKVGKYVNSPTSPLFEKHNCLYGLYQAKQAISKLDRCYLVEGQMDVISMFQAGIENVVASGGTSLTQPQIRALHRFTNNITIIYDGDKAGIKAALRGIDMILEEGINVRVLLLPDGEDPDSFARTHSAEELTAYIEEHQEDFIRFKTKLLADEIQGDPIRRGQILQSVLQSVACVHSVPVRLQYIKNCARIYDTDEKTLLKTVNKLIRDKMENASNQSTQFSTDNTEENKEDDLAELMYSSTDIARQEYNSKFDKNMLNLLQVIVRDGEKTMYALEGGQPITVGEYIIAELKNDEIIPNNPLYQKVLDDFVAHYHEDKFVAANFFLHHDNMQINHLAVDLIADKYQLSKLYAEQSEELPGLVDRLLLELKLTVVTGRIDAMQKQLEEAQEKNDWSAIQNILQVQPMLIDIRAAICKALGIVTM
ncbi:MAG: DNA primase [Paludibacteraceae bacterium]|nr:DNA primase [Paludibacteraceae bacterium]